MSRVFKFRAYGEIYGHENQMVYLTDDEDFFVDNEGKLLEVIQTEGGCYYREPEPQVLMQFTGLQDKYGNFDEETENQDIYEYDIILDIISGKYFEVVFEESCGCYLFVEVGTNEGLTYEEFEDISSFWVVYGNRFEHPHLLDGGDDIE